MRSRALEMLRWIAGPDAEFRPGQWEAIQAVAEERRRALVVQRTGWGKSAVYFIATSLLRQQGMGPTVIVSPLLVLMRNQIQMAERLGLSARTVNSTNREAWDPVFEEIRAGAVDLLLISPERLNNPTFRTDVLPDLLRSLGLLVVDEVHCISDWGHDFRPDYRRLSRIVRLLPSNVAVLGTTATANDRVVADAAEQLGDDLLVVRGSLDRESLRLQVLNLPDAATRLAWLGQVIPTLEGCGIVYCLTVRDANRVGEWLASRGIEARSYTGAADSEDRLQIEELLTSGRLKAVVATSALGMGYDNPHIRFVIHYQAPGSPVAYYQQVGRAGRAVDSAYGVLLTGAEDRDIQDYFIRTAFPSSEHVDEVLGALAASGGLRLGQLETVNLPRGRLEATLKILEVEGAVYREGSTWHRSASAWQYPAARIEAVSAHRRREQSVMLEYGSTKSCLMEMLRSQLDDEESAPCGRCANCAGPFFAAEVDDDTVQEAIGFIRREADTIEPRRRWPIAVDGSHVVAHPVKRGRVLTRWGDPGLARAVETGKYRDDRFADELVEAFARMVGEWGPRPWPEWITPVPRYGGGGLVDDLTHRLAAELGLEFFPAVEKIRETRPQKMMQNSTRQARNLLGTFRVKSVRSGPVLLVDDVVDSRWTLTVVGDLLGAAGSGPVYPVALTDTSRRDS